MSKIVLTADLAAKLRNMQQAIELIDEQGQTLGFALSPAKFHASVDLSTPACPFTEEEMRTAFDDLSDGITTAELLARLRAL